MKKENKLTKISVIMPCYNDSEYILEAVESVEKCDKDSYEIIIVDDGSSDNTPIMLKNLRKKYNFRTISYKRNQGKGFAIKTGMLAAKGKFRLFTDTDLSTPIEEFNKFLEDKKIKLYDRSKQTSYGLITNFCDPDGNKVEVICP